MNTDHLQQCADAGTGEALRFMRLETIRREWEVQA
jgi:hypothetical protein